MRKAAFYCAVRCSFKGMNAFDGWTRFQTVGHSTVEAYIQQWTTVC